MVQVEATPFFVNHATQHLIPKVYIEKSILRGRQI